jgi:hypothetical protein
MESRNIIHKTCEYCEFYDIIRTEYRLGNCALDHFQEPIEVSADHSCDQWLERSDDE